MVLPVKVWGRDAKGKPFFQLAHTLDINRGGASLGGMQSLVNFDDTIEVQHRHKKARFRVAWVGRPGTPRANQIGTQYLEPEKDIWALELPEDSAPDQFQAAVPVREAKKPQAKKPTGKELRAHERFSVSGGVEVRTSGKAEVGQWTILTDLSAGGCYVNTSTPLPVNSRPALLVRTGNTEIRTWAAVRTCHPGVGMGLEFTDMTAADRVRLDSLIQGLTVEKPKLTTDLTPEVAARVKKATRDLREIDELLKSVDLDPRILREFRAALGHARHTAWALQQWIELQKKHADPLPVVAYLNSERIRIATYLCRNLAVEIQEMDVSHRATEFENLVRAVEELFQRLAGFRFAVDDRAVLSAPFRELSRAEEAEPPAPQPAPAVAAAEADPAPRPAPAFAAKGSPEVAPPAPSPVAPAVSAAEERRAKKDRRRRAKKRGKVAPKQERRAGKDRRGSTSAGAV